ncbi:hypothetical protein GCM10027290_31770 [Micromonospora sonneratiae]
MQVFSQPPHEAEKLRRELTQLVQRGDTIVVPQGQYRDTGPDYDHPPRVLRLRVHDTGSITVIDGEIMALVGGWDDEPPPYPSGPRLYYVSMTALRTDGTVTRPPTTTPTTGPPTEAGPGSTDTSSTQPGTQ